MAEWDQRPDEPSRWFDRFNNYRSLGPQRTMQGAFDLWKSGSAKAIKSTRPTTDWYEMAERWEWVKRATAYDDKERAKALKVEEGERAAMLKRHAGYARQLQQAALLGLKQIINTKGVSLNAADVARMIKLGIDEERKSVGLPNEILELLNDDPETLLAKYAGALGELEETGGPGSGDADAGYDPADDAEAGEA